MKVYALALLALVGCGAAEQHPPVPTQEPRPDTAITDEQVQEYYDEFMQLCDYTNHTLCHTNAPKLRSIQIVDKEELLKQAAKIKVTSTTTVGLCVYSYRTNNPTNIISSNVYLLNNNGYGQNWYPDELRALIFHELGHCLLQLEHPNPTRPSTDPAIMNYQMYRLSIYQSNWDTMVTELFAH